MIRPSLWTTALALASTFAIASDSIIVDDNAGWCWFQDERAIIYGDTVIVGSVANRDGADGRKRQGDIEIHQVSPDGIQHFTLHDRLQPDDHNVPALLELPDGRILAAYAKHGSDNLMRWRITQRPGDIRSWSTEQTFDIGARCTYANLIYLAEEDRIYLFHRGRGWDPNYLISNDHGKSFQYGGKLLENTNDPTGKIRPYLKYTSNNQDTIHIAATQAHPRDEATNIYHATVRDGMLYTSDGKPIQKLSEAPATPESLTQVFKGSDNARAWTVDLHLDADDNPVMVFSVHLNPDDHRYHYARWTGDTWSVHNMAFAGTCLYEKESSYTGLAAIDPADPTTVFISTDAHPLTGVPTAAERRYEIFRGKTHDEGATWEWQQLTTNSTTDNLRPIVPESNFSKGALLWLQGTYSTYTKYNQSIRYMEFDR